MAATKTIRLAMCAVLVACSGGSTAAVTEPTPARPPYPVGLTDQSFAFGGGTRQFRIHVPSGLTTPRAIVVVLHGGGGAGTAVANTGAHPLSVFRTVADRERFVVVYPAGLPSMNGDVGWNDCRADNLNGSTADDVGFLAALMERIREQYGLPSSRVFMAGGSNGGLMTFAFLLHRAELIAAAATSSANLPRTPRPGACSGIPSRPAPLLMTHGTLDPAMPYAGGCVANLGGGCARGQVISAIATRDRWLQISGLLAVSPRPSVVELDPNDGGAANRLVYDGASSLEWWRLDGAGHVMASRSVLVAPSADAGVQNRDIEFAEAAWAFFAARLPQ